MPNSDLRHLPKALLHDHLDGGVRIETLLDLAVQQGYDRLPADDAAGLAAAFHMQGSSSLEDYLAAFAHVVAVMQTEDALERVAYEHVVDVAADGVVYLESRFAPHQHLAGGLSPDEVVTAAAAGLARGQAETGCVARLIVAAMRNTPGSEDVARLAVAHRDAGVVAFDLSGPEAGYPADGHLAACHIAREAGLGLTLHAGEGDGTNSIWRALQRCGAHRIGHGVRIVEDTVTEGGDVVALGTLAAAVRDRRVPLEVCIQSNVDIGLYPDPASHPVGALYRAGFAVTLNTDNRLMSQTSMTGEFTLAVTHHGFGPAELRDVTETALRAGFADWPTRRRLIDDVVRPAYAALV